jgi:uncharacterized protein (TIGR02246 family)
MDGHVTDAVGAVVRRHLDAVASGDPEAMAADYAPEALLERAGDRYEGREAIRRYFATVPDRLGGGRVEFERVRIDGSQVRFSWRIQGGPADGTAGTDTCTVVDGWIVHQTVRLESEDF